MTPGPVGYGKACSADGLLATFALELGLAGELKNPELLFLRDLPARLLLLPFRLAGFAFDFAGVAGGDTRADDGSGCWLPLRSRASISSLVRLTFVFPFALAFAILSNADWSTGFCFSLAVVCCAMVL